MMTFRPWVVSEVVLHQPSALSYTNTREEGVSVNNKKYISSNFTGGMDFRHSKQSHVKHVTKGPLTPRRPATPRCTKQKPTAPSSFIKVPSVGLPYPTAYFPINATTIHAAGKYRGKLTSFIISPRPSALNIYVKLRFVLSFV